jgi:NitT/TauT family transport system ATP-binding protein
VANQRENLLRVDQASVWHGDLHVLGPVSFEVAAGSCSVLLGPSGCGKSTLLAAVAGLQALKTGSATVESGIGQPGLVFQTPNLMPWASALDNVALPLVLAGVERKLAHARALESMARTGIADFAAARPRALSGGMAMRVALARALVTEPAALLLDEPFAAIDELGRRQLNDLVHEVKAAQNIPVLFVTHSVEEAVYMGDQVLVISPRPGRILTQIDVLTQSRDRAFLLSKAFGETVAAARSALAGEAHQL